jgi:Coenzyme PQQ synthesis protein D (PqqD)
MDNTDLPRARSRDLVILTRPDETLVYDMVSNEAHCLNETAAFVWSQCSGDASIGEIAMSAAKRFSGFVSEEFVTIAITQLDERKLLSSPGLGVRSQPGRREAISKIGLASAVAVPMILSIVAPARALGTLSCRISCTSPGQCLQFPQCGNFCSSIGECAPSAAASVPAAA